MGTSYNGIGQQIGPPILSSYDKFIVYFSGGKDSIAAFLHLLDIGVPREKIELWHHLVDGAASEKQLMDWRCTTSYCERFAQDFGVPIYFSWREGGFRKEMLRENSPTGKVFFEVPTEAGKKLCSSGGTSKSLGTRLRFPQVSANLSVRWCSAYLKIMVAEAAIRNQKRFDHTRTLTISGERRQESRARAGYSEFEVDRSDARAGRSKRHVDRWRPVIDLTEQQVWEMLERHRVDPHPAYKLGWSRLSCQNCIFNDGETFGLS